MGNLLRKLVLPATIFIFCALIGWNAYKASTNLRTVQQYADARVEASKLEAAIAAVQSDLQAIETGQRGYLLTGDASYLAPYTHATQRLQADFSTLRKQLGAEAPQERSIETELESVAQAKIADAEETIRLREKGYRHRAFLVVDSNRGKELMDQARSLLDRLSSMATGQTAGYDHQLSNSVTQAWTASALGSLLILALTVITLVAFHWRRNKLEKKYERQKEQLRATTAKLEHVIATLSASVCATVTSMQEDAETLLNNHAGFLPRQGQERAEAICDGISRLSASLDNLLDGRVAIRREDRTVSGIDAAIMTTSPDADQRWGTVA